VFLTRARRLATLSAGHAASRWLSALSLLCEAQHASLGRPDWSAALDQIAARMSEASLPESARDALARVRDASLEVRASWAASLESANDVHGSAGETPDGAVALFVGAALQVQHTVHASRLRRQDVARVDSHCPVCRARAAVGVITGDAKARYLACSRCSSAWHRVRVQCTTCGATSGLEYLALEGGHAPGVKAEACARCRTYLKLFYEEERHDVEPLADDAATLALDVLMGEAGWARGGANALITAG